MFSRFLLLSKLVNLSEVVGKPKTKPEKFFWRALHAQQFHVFELLPPHDQLATSFERTFIKSMESRVSVSRRIYCATTFSELEKRKKSGIRYIELE